MRTRPSEQDLHGPTQVNLGFRITLAGVVSRGPVADQLLITMPFYASVAYSFGALLARNEFTKAPEKLTDSDDSGSK